MFHAPDDLRVMLLAGHTWVDTIVHAALSHMLGGKMQDNTDADSVFVIPVLKAATYPGAARE
eukprot:4197367-Amphidinium_carterae.2